MKRRNMYRTKNIVCAVKEYCNSGYRPHIAEFIKNDDHEGDLEALVVDMITDLLLWSSQRLSITQPEAIVRMALSHYCEEKPTYKEPAGYDRRNA